MSTVTSAGIQENDLKQELLQFYDTWCFEEIAELAQKYPNEKRSLYIEAKDLRTYNDDITGKGKSLLDKWAENPNEVQNIAEAALRDYENPPAQFDFSGGDGYPSAYVRLTDTESTMDRYGVGELRNDQGGKYVAVSGQLSAVTGAKDRIVDAAFECQRCGTMTYIPQRGTGFQEPHECTGCERQGPFDVDHDQSQFVDERKIQVRQPPEDASNGEGQAIEGYVRDDLADIGGPNGLPSRAGDRVIVFGVVERRQLTQGQKKEPVFERYLDVQAIHFENSDLQEIDPREFMDKIEEHANAENPVQRFAESIIPEHYTTPQWERGLTLLTAYLFGCPRLDPKNGPTIRGDIHCLLIGDPSTGKSQALSAISEISPDSERRSATGLSSNVGLTAAATKDDFGDGQFTLKPGILARAGWHAIIDEIDKGPEDLTKINDALEGEQVITVDKAGISAKLDSRTSLLASGNPKHGRFQPHGEGWKEQIDIDPSLFSRFDGVVVLTDEQDEELDSAIAETIGKSFQEAAAMEEADRNGDDPQDVEREVSDRTVPMEVMQAWVKYARENIFPLPSQEVMDMAEEKYVELRSINNNGGENAPSAMTRDYLAMVRYAVAFARVRLSETVSKADMEMAANLQEELIRQTEDESGNIDRALWGEERSQADIKTDNDVVMLVDAVASEQDHDKGAPFSEVVSRLVDGGMTEKNAKDRLSKLRFEEGRLMEHHDGYLLKA